MKNLRIKTLTIFFIMLFILGIKKYHDFEFTKKQTNDEKNLIKESFRVLNECFDLENKNKRTLDKSIKLIEFCIEEYGYNK